MKTIIAALVLLTASAFGQESEALRLAKQLTAQTLARHAHQHDPNMTMDVADDDAPEVRKKVENFTADQVKELERAMTPANDPQTASAAAFALWVAEPQRVDDAVETLLVQMDRMMFFDPHLAHQLIGEIGSPAVPTLADHIEQGMVVDVVESLGPRAAAAVPALLARLGDDNVDMAAALAAIGTKEAVARAKPVLIRALDDPANPLAKDAVQALGNLGARAKDALPAVRRGLASNDPDTRMYAAIALIQIGDTAAGLAALGTLVRTNAIENEFAAFERLRVLGARAKPVRDDLIAVLRDPKREEERIEAAAALLAIDPKHPDVVKALRDAAAEPALFQTRPEVLRQIEQLQ